MTIFINARFLCQPVSGVQRFAGEILNALDKELDRNIPLRKELGPIVALRPAGALHHPHWHNIAIRQIEGAQGHLWEQGALYRASKQGVLISLGNSGPLRHPAQLLALHDANIWDIPASFSTRYRILQKALRPALAHRAAGLITVSNFSAHALSQHLNMPTERFGIVPNGADHILQVQPDDSIFEYYGLHKKRYLLSVGNHSPNKNLVRLVQAHTLAGPEVDPLVIVGGTSPALETLDLIQSKRVIPLGRINDNALRSLYEQASGFIFPSLYEGFGIPPLEAMQMGTPVMAAYRTAMPEVLQDGPLWFDPLDLESMMKTLQEFSDMSENRRSHMIARGYQIAGKFTWSKSAQLLAQQILKVKAKAASAAPGVRSHNVERLHKSM